jgi:hypothetical protein
MRAASRRTVLGGVFLLIALAAQLEGQGTNPACARVIATKVSREVPSSSRAVYEASEACVAEWADSLRSANAAHASAARYALVLIGGRSAVDALRADAERVPSRDATVAAVTAMASTGSADDISFLLAHLGIREPTAPPWFRWQEFEAAVTSLGLLRVERSRDSLGAAYGRTKPNTFPRRSLQVALEALDRPACADSIGGDPRELIRIVVGCRPPAMWTSTRYADRESGDIWAFMDGEWRLDKRTPADTGRSMPHVTFGAMIGADGSHAEVTVSTWCGGLCGEGWTFRLMRTGKVWRVVGAVRDFVS